MDYYRVNELPHTYKRCKAYTDQFEEWLASTARKRGLELQAEVEEAAHLKKGRQKKQYKVPLARLVPLAKGIAESIAESNVPLDDVSGLKDLNDAIRSRKEVTEWYRVNDKSDKGHPFFTSRLIEVRDIFKNLIPDSFRRTVLREHDIVDEAPSYITVIVGDTSFQMEDDSDEGEGNEEKNGATSRPKSQVPDSSVSFSHNWKKGLNFSVLTKDEIELEQNYRVLCFLFDFNRLRDFIRQAWLDYNNRKINAITAALVTDLAQGIIQQNVAALAEDLVDGERSLNDIIKKLYVSTSSTAKSISEVTANPTIHQLLCIDAIKHMEEYQRLKCSSSDNASAKFNEKEFPYMEFLLYFDRIRTKTLRPPIADKFTEAMQSSTVGLEPWLPFGLQVMIDIQEIIRSEHHEIFRDVTDNAIGLSKLMRAHCEYEDNMWAIGNRPEYMSQGETKFSTVFLKPAADILDWLNQLLEDDAPGSTSKMDNSFFITCHPVLGGLVMYHFHKLYYAIGIQKVTWFIVALCHLYNAARQIGGLSVRWPDLDFIIEMQGTKRIFVGDPPKDPNFFDDRIGLAMCTSTRQYAKDLRHAKWIKSNRETFSKRGLMPHFPLEEKIRDYYSANKDARWILLHNIFAHMVAAQDQEKEAGLIDEESQKALQDLQSTFTSVATLISPPQPRGKHRNRRQKPKITAPDFSSLGATHVELLSKMKNQLRDHELHSNFDYLRFYRRAFALITHIRGEVLHDATRELSRLDSEEADPTNHTLLIRLFCSLKIQPKDKKVEAKEDALSKDVVALGQLQKISKIMGELIQEEGRMELDNAEKGLRRWWDAIEPAHPSLGMIKGPKGIYHHFTYSSTVSRKRKLVILRTPSLSILAFRPSAKGLPHRLVGKKKRRVAFTCHGGCPMGRVCLGLESKMRRLKKEIQDLRERIDRIDADSVIEDWESESGPDASDREDAQESSNGHAPSYNASSMPSTFQGEWIGGVD